MCRSVFTYRRGARFRPLRATPESIVKVYFLCGQTTSSSRVCGFGVAAAALRGAQFHRRHIPCELDPRPGLNHCRRTGMEFKPQGALDQSVTESVPTSGRFGKHLRGYGSMVTMPA